MFISKNKSRKIIKFFLNFYCQTTLYYTSLVLQFVRFHIGWIKRQHKFGWRHFALPTLQAIDFIKCDKVVA
ncbi:hypothetical protein BGP_1403 [Beggiatoa sp. PS]|nr:hypothetical protein BGP_1403 [Beggiatoa sp. PS]